MTFSLQPENGGDSGVGTSCCAEPFALVNFLPSAVSFILEYYRRNIEICRSKFLRRLVERYQRGRFLALLELAHSPLGCQVFMREFLKSYSTIPGWILIRLWMDFRKYYRTNSFEMLKIVEYPCSYFQN